MVWETLAVSPLIVGSSLEFSQTRPVICYPPKNAYRGALCQLIPQKSNSWGLLKAQTEVFSTPHIKGGEHHIRTIMVFRSPSRTCRVARLEASVTLPMEISSPPLPSENVIGIIL